MRQVERDLSTPEKRKYWRDLDCLARNQCSDHPKYQTKRKPRTLCEGCWRQWIWAQDLKWKI